MHFKKNSLFSSDSMELNISPQYFMGNRINLSFLPILCFSSDLFSILCIFLTINSVPCCSYHSFYCGCSTIFQYLLYQYLQNPEHILQLLIFESYNFLNKFNLLILFGSIFSMIFEVL